MESVIRLELLIALLLQAPAVLLLPGTLLLFLEVAFAGGLRRGDANVLPATLAPPFTVLVCAHDEEPVIGETLAGLIPQLRDGDHLLVVADNCTDRTAAIARTCGAEVTERHDPARRGKGYALEHGLAAAAQWSPAVVVVVDADCTVAPGGLVALAARVAALGRPAQALNLSLAPPGADTISRFHAFAVRVKNGLRAAGGARLGLPGLLTGTGMALSPAMLATVRLGSAERVEDLVLGIDLARAGLDASFCPEVTVTSPLPQTPEAIASQRRRWEGGALGVTLRRALPLLGEALRRGRPRLMLLALDIAVPPLSLLAGLALTGAGAVLGLAGWVIALPLAECALFALTVALAWHRRGRDLLGPADLGALAAQFARKLGFYLGLLGRRREGWVRTQRDTPPPGA